MIENERNLVNFILPARQARYIELLSTTRGREKFRHALAHFRHFDGRWVVPIRSSDQNAAAIDKLLRKYGAPDVCYIFSEASSVHDEVMPLTQALVGNLPGTIVVCVSSTLGYYEGERERFILINPIRPSHRKGKMSTG